MKRHITTPKRIASLPIASSERLKSLWEMGAAIGKLKPGYRRVPSHPATLNEPAKGPYYDELDPNWQPVIQEAYERIARGEPPWLVGKWLTEQGIAKASGATLAEWTARDVISFIRRPDHHGVQKYRITVSKKRFRKGGRKSKRNDPDKNPHPRNAASPRCPRRSFHESQ